MFNNIFNIKNFFLSINIYMSANDSMADSLLNVNNLNYGMPPMPSVATGRTHISVFPQTVSASQGGNIIFNVSSGSQFINGPGSYLQISLTTVGGNTATMMPSVGSLFSNVIVTAQNGVELSRVNDLAMYMQKGKYQMTHDKRVLLKDTEGLYKVLAAGAGTYKFILRLDALPIFKNHSQLLPPQMMEGLRIQFGVNSIARAFKSAVAVTSFSVTSVLKLDAVTLSDAFLRRVNEISANQGLVLMHEEPFHSETSSSTVNLNFNINKACSKAVEFCLLPRLSSVVDSVSSNSSSTEPYNISAIQLQAGSQYYPIQSLTQTATGLNSSAEPFHYVLLNATNGKYNSSVHYDHFYQDFSATTGCEAAFFQNLREGSANLTGVLLNNSRSLIVNATMGSAVARVFTTYLSHIRMVRVFQNNAIVRD